MPKSVNQKQKLLFLLDYLRQNTDETHTVTTPQIIDHLAANGIRAQRGFQANSRVITVSDTLLEELINLKR